MKTARLRPVAIENMTLVVSSMSRKRGSRFSYKDMFKIIELTPILSIRWFTPGGMGAAGEPSRAVSRRAGNRVPQLRRGCVTFATRREVRLS